MDVKQNFVWCFAVKQDLLLHDKALVVKWLENKLPLGCVRNSDFGYSYGYTHDLAVAVAEVAVLNTA